MAQLHVGQLASFGVGFCPYAAVTKWPYRYLHGQVSQDVSEAFFAHGAFRERCWTIFYIHTRLDSTQKPLLLIPQAEVQQLFHEIGEAFDIYAAFPDAVRDPGFQIDFVEEGSPRPRYLGRLINETSIQDLEMNIPAQGSAAEEPEDIEDRSLAAFRRKMEDSIQSGKNKKPNKAKKRLDRIGVKKGWCAQLKRSQCYLGLRNRGNVNREDYLADPNMSWEETQKAQEAYEIAAGIKMPPLNTDLPVPYRFDRNVVFVCVDVESFERDHNKVTEIGICTLDTLDLIKLPPGAGGAEWMKQMRCRHFRIAEYSHLNNTDFVTGCADKFEPEFGVSEWISIKEAPYVTGSCFKPPYSEKGKYIPYPPDKFQRLSDASRIKNAEVSGAGQKRNIVIVGHDTSADIEYLRKIGYDIGNLSNVVEAIDTALLYRAYKHEHESRKLGMILLELGLTGWNLHNAGNDAAYTTQVLIGICLAALNSSNKPPLSPSTEKLDEAAKEAKQRLIEESEEWQAAEEEGGDGGEAIPLLPADQRKADEEFTRAMNKGRKADEYRRIEQARKQHRGDGGRGGRDGSRGGGARARAGGRGKGRGRGGGGGAGGGGEGWGGGRQPAPKQEPESSSMPFDEDAMDEAMGFGGDDEQDGGVRLDGAADSWTTPLAPAPAPLTGPAGPKGGKEPVPPHLRSRKQKQEKAGVNVEALDRMKLIDDTLL